MKHSTTFLVLASFIVLTLMGYSTDARTNASTPSDNSRRLSRKKTLRPFATKQELEKFLRDLAEKQVKQTKALPLPHSPQHNPSRPRTAQVPTKLVHRVTIPNRSQTSNTRV